MPGGANSPHLRLLRKLGKLTEIARTIDINRYDGEFRQVPNARIYYVFDTNIFQLFLKPFTYSRYLELFESPNWTTSRSNFSVNSESALVSAEYLFGGELPLQQNDDVIITSWHHMELSEQIGHLLSEIRQTLSTPEYVEDLGRGVEYLNELCELLTSHDRPRFESLRDRRGITAVADDERLEAQGFSIERRIEIFCIRSICQFLASDRYTEPMEQLRRLLGEVVRFNSHSGNPRFEITDAQRKRFNVIKSDWAKRIREADRAFLARRRRRLEQSGGDPERKPGRSSVGRPRLASSIAHDSAALAWLDVIHELVLEPNERIVFVTGDRVVLNACRRRNADDPGRPFLTRSVQHFAPLLNLTDADSDLSLIGDPRQHFAAMRRAIEQGLALLNLSLDETDSLGRIQRHRVTGRDNFLVDVEEKDGDILSDYHEGLFELFFREDWVTEKEAELNQIALPFQEMERLAVSSFSDKILARVESTTALKMFREWRESNLAEEFGPAIERAMRSLLDEVENATMDFTIRSVPRFVETLTSEPSRLYQRAVYRVRLELPTPGGARIPIEHYVRDLTQPKGRKRKSDAHLETIRRRLDLLRDKPALLFCLAIILAFRSERWALAANMAELAAEAIMDDGSELRGEIEYIRSVALRYRLASIYPDLQEAKSDVWLRWLQAAEQAQASALDAFPQNSAPVRHMRSLSELAAVRLAYLEWVAYARIDRLPEHRENVGAFRASISHILSDAWRDLEHCAAISEILDRSSIPETETVRAEHASAISNHWRWNMVVADVTGRKLVRLGLLSPDAQVSLITPAVLNDISARRKGHLIYDIYRAQLSPPGKDMLQRIAAGVRRRELSLALDVAVANDLLETHGIRIDPSS